MALVSYRRGWLRGQWKKPPSVYSEGGEGVRHATWMELFFDLVFVVAIAERLPTNE